MIFEEHGEFTGEAQGSTTLNEKATTVYPVGVKRMKTRVPGKNSQGN